MNLLVALWLLAGAVSSDTYDAAGRRDPFVHPSVSFAHDGPVCVIPPTPPRGYLIEEATLEGIVTDRNGPLALLRFVDGKSVPVREGAEFYDGRLVRIGPDGLEFEVDPIDENDTMSRRSYRLTFPSSP